jgi:primosomal protein N' (replication factor Y)
MDEEHESCYFSETSPKYNTHEVAKKICELTNAKLILGSATPSIETYYLTQEKKIDLVEMPTRVNKKIPDIKIIDMRKELISGNTNIFSRELIIAINKALNNKEQVILFLNRRGYSNFVSCLNCGFVFKCSACDISYTYHAFTKNLICHYCGEKINLPKVCPVCNSKYIKNFGIGTEKVEQEIKKIFPEQNILRMDSDTVTKKSDYQRIFKAFANKKANILVGTQMIAKGLDFPSVSVVGIISADVSLNSSDFRCSENTFQLVTQVSGRAGRAETEGSAFIQTYNPNHYAITSAQKNDYKSFYSQEIAFRKSMNYPPFTNIFCILMTSTNEILLIKKINLLKQIFMHCDKKKQFNILGPSQAIIYKIKNNFRQRILIKHRDENYLKKFVLFGVDFLRSHDSLENVKLNLTLNPIYML